MPQDYRIARIRLEEILCFVVTTDDEACAIIDVAESYSTAFEPRTRRIVSHMWFARILAQQMREYRKGHRAPHPDHTILPRCVCITPVDCRCLLQTTHPSGICDACRSGNHITA